MKFNKLFRCILLTTIVISIVGCGTITSPEANTPNCQNWDDISPETQNTIQTTAFTILQNLANGQLDRVWEAAHPFLQEAITQQAFIKNMEEIESYLPSDISDAKFIDGRLITLTTEETSKTFNVVCGSESIDDLSYLKVKITVPVETTVVAMIYVPDEQVGRTLSLKLAEDNNQFKIFGIDFTSTQYKNKEAMYYAELGEQWLAEDRTLSGYIASILALNLSYLSTFLQDGENARLSEMVMPLSEDLSIQSKYSTWRVGDTVYNIHYVGLIVTFNDIFPHIMYISYTDLTEETTPPEAELLLEYLNQNYPELGTIFDGVLFEAYQKAPTDPNKNYPYYREFLKFNTTK